MRVFNYTIDTTLSYLFCIIIYYNNRNRFYLIKEYEFGFYCRLYTAITRTCRYITARLRKSNDSVIYEAYKDFRHGIKGPKVF